jgi:uncharacterized membrane protein YebE (DUF533 family)
MEIIVGLVALMVGAVVGIVGYNYYQNTKGNNRQLQVEEQAKTITNQANNQAKSIIGEAESKAKGILDETERTRISARAVWTSRRMTWKSWKHNALRSFSVSRR